MKIQCWVKIRRKKVTRHQCQKMNSHVSPVDSVSSSIKSIFTDVNLTSASDKEVDATGRVGRDA